VITDMERYWFESTQQRVGRLVSEYEHAKRSVGERRQDLKRRKRELRDSLRAQEVLQEVAKQVQQQAHEKIAGVVTKCLAAVFPDPYVFEIVFEKKRGKTEVHFEFVRRGLRLKPQDGVGGSVLDVSAFALRLACLGLQRPVRRKAVFMDEAFGGVSGRQGNKDRLRDLLEVLSAELGFQVILVTHDPDLRAGKVVDIKSRPRTRGRKVRTPGTGKQRQRS
jgi:hypothetical protein